VSKVEVDELVKARARETGEVDSEKRFVDVSLVRACLKKKELSLSPQITTCKALELCLAAET